MTVNPSPITGTGMRNGWTVRCEIGTNANLTVCAVNDAEFARIKIRRDKFQAEWNYPTRSGPRVHLDHAQSH